MLCDKIRDLFFHLLAFVLRKEHWMISISELWDIELCLSTCISFVNQLEGEWEMNWRALGKRCLTVWGWTCLNTSQTLLYLVSCQFIWVGFYSPHITQEKHWFFFNFSTIFKYTYLDHHMKCLEDWGKRKKIKCLISYKQIPIVIS